MLQQYMSNAILAQPIKDRTAPELLKAFQVMEQELVARGLKPKLMKLDNEASKLLKAYLHQQDITFQLVPPYSHRRNSAERAIRSFKYHLIAGICSTDKLFPIHLWDRLLPQAVKTDWKPMYGYVKEATPPNAPVRRGKEIDLRLFVEYDHAGEHFTRRSRTGFVIYLDMVPIMWFYKRQPTVESSVFGAEFVEMKNSIETTRGLRYKLSMMGVAIDGPTYVYGDNMSMVHNTQRPESVLKKKSNAICYHAVRESAAMGESIIGHIPSVNNPADICTKDVSGGQKRDHLIGLLLHDIVD
jgi:hypothetical protein